MDKLTTYVSNKLTNKQTTRSNYYCITGSYCMGSLF